ncbi:MAG: sodium:proton antiporter [Lachnospiraceae bacterium]|nr:sodium:proton antiporter [Lachnospiraceae bacterium]
MELLVLGLFCVSLLLCLATGLSILYALVLGLLLFMLYGRHKGFAWKELLNMALAGVKTVQGILITFLLIGVMTALWRAAGTIPTIVTYASGLIRPSVFLLMTFLLCGAVSILTGTSLGTAATMGVICASMGTAMGASPLLTGGAVLSGAFFGDRCSPVSTSALLVAAVTKTDIYDNIRRMVKSALVPFLLTCAVYLALGLFLPRGGGVLDLEALFSRAFVLHPVTLLPAAAILVLAAFRVKVKAAMCASILTAVPICLFLQGIPPAEVLRAAVFGFVPQDPQVAAMVSGGGVLSMLRVSAIVCLSSSYSDLFDKTGLLDGAKHAAASLAAKTTPFAATLVSSILSGMLACNQTLAILLTHELCADVYADGSDMALDLEDTAVVTSPLIPWSIAVATPLTTVGAPIASVCAAFYLMLLPLWRLLLSLRRTKS